MIPWKPSDLSWGRGREGEGEEGELGGKEEGFILRLFLWPHGTHRFVKLHVMNLILGPRSLREDEEEVEDEREEGKERLLGQQE